MSYIPDCRTDDFYNYDNLEKDGKTIIDGYDFAIEDIKNIDVEDFLDPSVDLKYLVAHHKDAIEEVISEVLTRLEMSRNELITSMIDGQN